MATDGDAIGLLLAITFSSFAFTQPGNRLLVSPKRGSHTVDPERPSRTVVPKKPTRIASRSN